MDLKSKNKTNDILHQPLNCKFEDIVVMLVAQDRKRGKDVGCGKRQKYPDINLIIP